MLMGHHENIVIDAVEKVHSLGCRVAGSRPALSRYSTPLFVAIFFCFFGRTPWIDASK